MLIVLLAAAIVFIVLATVRLQLHPFLALILAALAFGLLAGMPPGDVVKAVNEGFGNTIGKIGIVILGGCIIGIYLEKTGGARRLAESALRLTGERNVPLAMAIVGYIVSIPVFCDSGFVLLSPLNKALARRTGASLTAGAIALSLGLYATHTMVPPTPGPVAAAGYLGADLGLVILFGMLAGVVAMFTGWGFAVIAARSVPILPEPDTEVEAAAATEDKAPSAAKSLVPILLPILLIVLGSIAALPDHPLGEGQLATVAGFLGQPVIALLLGVGAAFLLPRRFELKQWSAGGWAGEAVLSAAMIIVVTGAGGAFGKVLEQSGIGTLIGDTLKSHSNIGLWLPFLIAAGLKTAQGSSTVAIITTATMIAPMLPALGLDSGTARALTAVGIGAGAMVVSHVNDSFFWVVTQFSGMTVRQGYRLQTLGTLVEGTAAGVAVWFLSLILL